jgi:prepilin-type N-terminal cleavage/methylation domain-containing protein
MGSSWSAPARRAIRASIRRGQRGFTLVESLVVIVVIGLVLGAGIGSLKKYLRQQQVDRAADAILWEITVARSYAVREGEAVSLVIDEANRKLIVRDATKTWRTLDMGPGTELPVDLLTIDVPGDSLVFSFRGFCLNCSNVSSATLSVTVGARQRQIQVGFLGRAERVH